MAYDEGSGVISTSVTLALADSKYGMGRVTVVNTADVTIKVTSSDDKDFELSGIAPLSVSSEVSPCRKVPCLVPE